MNAIAEYTNRYELNSGTNVLAGSANVAGLINTSQWAHISFRSNNLITSANQRSIKGIGAFWMNQWSYDTLFWWMAGEEPRLLPVNVEPLDVLNHALATKDRVQAAATDTTGDFFGRDLPADCAGNFVVDARTGAPYAIAQPNPSGGAANGIRGFDLVVGNRCDDAGNWHGVDATQREALGRMAGYLAGTTGVTSAYVGSTRTGAAAGRCFEVDLGAVIRLSDGRLVACLRMALSSAPAVTDLVCTGTSGRVTLSGYARGRYGLAFRWSRPVSDCRSPIPLPDRFQGGLCVEGTPPFRCTRWVDVTGAITDTRGNFYGAPNHPTLLRALPFSWMTVPGLASGRTMQPSMSNQFFATRPLASGEVYLPRL
jgi:hypothetical protein